MTKLIYTTTITPSENTTIEVLEDGTIEITHIKEIPKELDEEEVGAFQADFFFEEFTHDITFFNL